MIYKEEEKRTVCMGELVLVKNKDKKYNENDNYVALHVEDESGDNEFCILFSENQIEKMKTISFPFMEKTMKNGKIYGGIINNEETNLIKVVYNKSFFVFRVSNTELYIAQERAIKNKEDLTKKGFITNLFD